MKNGELVFYCIIGLIGTIFLLAGGWKILLLIFIASLGV